MNNEIARSHAKTRTMLSAHASLVAVTIAKGVFTEAEYVDLVRAAVKKENARYSRMNERLARWKAIAKYRLASAHARPPE